MRQSGHSNNSNTSTFRTTYNFYLYNLDNFLGKSFDPRAFNGYKIPVKYMATDKGWI